ncbi:MAG: fibronectin type III domain-containing protein [Candidatus Kerfeldbacteria bacterium]|nr:fibronectin type III domain-containing protein [Candidatus Kerfeldbacteria bacterium]
MAKRRKRKTTIPHHHKEDLKLTRAQAKPFRLRIAHLGSFFREHRAIALPILAVLILAGMVSYQRITAATLTLTVPTDVDWDNAAATKSNTVKTGTDLVLSTTNNQFVDTNWGSNNYTSADYAINPTTETKLKAEVAQNFTNGSGLNTGSNVINDVFDNGTYLFIATAGGLDVITKSTNTSKGYVSLANGFTAVYADATNVYAGDGDGGVFKYVINNISGNTSVGSATYLSSTSPAIVNNNVNDLWGAVISGSTYLAVATAGGVTVVNETAATSKNSSETSSYSLVRVTTDNELYYYGSTTAKLQRKDNVSGLGAGFTETVNYTTATTPAILSNTINSLEATVNTSTAQATSNTIFVGTNSGLSILQEHSTQASGTVRHYVNEATAGNSGYASTGFKSALKFDGTDDYVKVSDDDDMDLTASFTVDMYVKFPSAFSADSQAKDAPLLSKGEQFQAYFDHQTGKLNFEFGDQGPLGAGASTASTVGLWGSLTGTTDHVNGVVEFNDVLYIGVGTSQGDGSVLAFDGDNWTTVLTTGTQYIDELIVFNSRLYIGTGGNVTDGYVYVCDPADSGGATFCDSGDWTISLNTLENRVTDLAQDGTYLYASVEDLADLWYCYPQASGDTNVCESADWRTYFRYDATNGIENIEVFNSRVYAGVGAAAGEADIFDLGNIHISYDDTGANYERFEGLTVFNGYLYAGGGTGDGDGDLFICDPATIGGATRCDNFGDWTKVRDTGFDAFMAEGAAATFNSKLYVGTQGIAGDGQIWVCDPAAGGASTAKCDSPLDWSLSYAPGSAYEFVSSLYVFNSYLYAGTGNSSGDGDVYYCNPATTGGATTCDSGDWAIAYDTSVAATNFNYVTDFTTLNSTMYVSFGGEAGEAELFYCTQSSNGNADICDANGDFTAAYDAGASYESARNIEVFNSRMYIGMGSSAGDADVTICNPATAGNASLCDNALDFTSAYANTSNQGSVTSFAAYNSELYMTTEGTAGSADLLKCTPGGDNECTSTDWVVYLDFDNYLSTRGLTTFTSGADTFVYFTTQGTATSSDADIWFVNSSDIRAWDGANTTPVNTSSYESIRVLFATSTALYAGFGDTSAGDGDLIACNPATSGGSTVCEDADWASSYDNSADDYVRDMETINGKVYASGGGSGGEGDVYECTPGADTICLTGEWTTVVNTDTSTWGDMGTYQGNLIVTSGTGTNGGANVMKMSNPTAYDGSNDQTWESVNFNDRLYTGVEVNTGTGEIIMCNPSGNGDADTCETADFSSIYTLSTVYNGVYSAKEFKGNLYGGMGDGSAEGDIAGCDVDLTGGATTCESGDFSLVYNSSLAENAIVFEEMNGYLYAGLSGSSAGDGDVIVCDPTTTGATDFCDSGDWSTSYNGSQELFNSLEVFNSRLYAGMGSGAGDGDVLMCNPSATGSATLCDSGDWSTVWDGVEYETVNALATFRGRLYAGFGSTAGGDNDVYMCDPSVGGTTTACDNANEWTLVYPGTKNTVNDLFVFQDKLYMNDEDREQLFACYAERAGNTEYCDDQSEWEEATASLSTYAEFNRLGSFQGELYVGQGLTSVGDVRSVGNAVTLQSTTTSWTADQWYLVSLVFNGSTASLYIDGTRQATRTISALPDPSEQALYIGRADHNGEEAFFNGTIDELLISDTAEHSGASFTVPGAEFSFPGSATKGLLLHFNDGSGTTATDSGTKSNNGTLTNGPLFRYHTLEGTIDNVSAVFPTSDGTRAWVATNAGGADDGSLTQLNSVNSANAVQGDSWRESSSTPNMVDNDMTAIQGAIASGNVADLVLGTSEGVTRFYPGVAPSGSLVSTIKDFGTTNSTWGNITFNSTANSQTITVKVRSSNNSDMSGATDWASCSGISSGTDMTTNSCMTDGHRYMQYRIDLSTTSASQNPQVEDVTVAASLLNGTWTYDFDAGITVGWSTLNFTTTEPSGTDVKFRFATSSDGVTYSSYSSYYTSSGASLSGLTSSRYLRIQAYLDSSSDDTSPTLDTFNITYERNLAPVIANLAVVAQTDGTAKVTYEASDQDDTSVTVTLQYSVDGGTTWNTPTTKTGNVGSGVAVTGTAATKTIHWTLSSNFTNSFLDDVVKVKVTLDDGHTLNNTASATSSSFDVDTKTPLAGATSITINSSASTTNSVAVTLTLSSSDDTAIQMTFSNDGTTFGTVVDTNGLVTNSGTWETYTTAKAWRLTAGSDGIRTAYVKYRDTYGNTATTASDTITLDTSANDIVTAVSVADASDAGLDRYSLAATWTPVTSARNPDFGGYVVQRSTDSSTYSNRATLNTITDSGFLDTGLAANSTYYYRIVTQDSAGNNSSPSSVAFGQPGGADAQGPDLSGEAPVAVTTQNSVTIAWTTDESSTSCIEFGTSSDYGTIVCDLEYVLAHQVEIENLQPQTTYSYRVRSTDANGNESIGDEYTFETIESDDDVTAPSVTGDGAIVTPTDSTATVTWVTNEPADSFVEFGDSEEFGTIQGDPTLITNHSVTIIGLTPLKVHYFRVRSTDEAGNLSLGETGTFLTTAPIGSDVPPTISDIGTQSAGVSSNTVIISWVTDAASTSSVVYGTTPANLDQETEDDQLLNVSHFVTLSNLSAATTYYYKVQSVDVYNNETISDVLNFTTSRAAIGNPSVLGLQVSSITLDSAIVSWTTNRIANSRLQYGEDTEYGTVINDESTDFTTQHTVLLDELNNGVTYHVQVIGAEENGSVIASDDYVFSTRTLPTVSGVTLDSVGYDTAKITWSTNVATDSIVEFGEAGLFDQSQGKPDRVTAHEIVLTSLRPKTTYSFRITGTDEFGNRAASGSNTLTTNADTAPPVLTGMKTEVSSLGAGGKVQAIVFWVADEFSTAQVEYSPGVVTGGQYQLRSPKDDTLNRSHTVILPGLLPSTTYHFRALSIDESGNIAQSSDFTLLTPQAAESVLEEVVSSLERTFSWVGEIKHIFFRKE